MTTIVQRSTAYQCAMLRNMGTGPQGVVRGEGEEGGGVVGWEWVWWQLERGPSKRKR